MKKILSTLLAASLMLLGTTAFAQMSVNAGYINSTRTAKNAESANANGAYAGISFNLPVAGGLAVAPGLYYSMITSTDVASLGSLYSGKGTFMEHAINVPVYVNYGFALAPDTKFFIFGGPTAQYGLASTVKTENNIAGLVAVNGKVDNYENEDYARFNVYLGGGVGFQAGAFQVTVGYDYGMMPLYKDTDQHRSNLKLGVGFLF
ncbi:MAG: PorT family protein [Bacteroidales bacterium]|nr:PorT family protein [Bacteroidales bacterium]